MNQTHIVITVDAERIRWIETLSGRKIRVRSAKLVCISYGDEAEGQVGYEVVTAGGGLCYVPLRGIVRIDVQR